MAFELSPGEKFALIAIDNLSRDQLPDEIHLDDGLSVHSKPPIRGGDTWREWIGSLKYAHLEESNFTIIAKATSTAPEVLDAENQSLQQRVLGIFYSLLLCGIPHMDGALDLTGANVDGDIQVRHIGILEHFYRAAGAHPHSVSEQDLETAQRTARGVAEVYAQKGEFGRFKRGLHSLLWGIREELANHRLHLFIRGLEALIKPAIGKTRKQFVRRGQVFIGGSSSKLLGELFDLRSCAEHLHDWDCGLEHIDESKREWHGNRRSYQAEVLACQSFLNALSNDGLLANFRNDSAIEAFWSLSEKDRQVVWGETLDLESIISGSFSAPKE